MRHTYTHCTQSIHNIVCLPVQCYQCFHSPFPHVNVFDDSPLKPLLISNKTGQNSLAQSDAERDRHHTLLISLPTCSPLQQPHYLPAGSSGSQAVETGGGANLPTVRHSRCKIEQPPTIGRVSYVTLQLYNIVTAILFELRQSSTMVQPSSTMVQPSSTTIVQHGSTVVKPNQIGRAHV